MLNNMDFANNEISFGYIRLIHAVPNAPNVDIYANDVIIAKDLSYGSLTDYFAVPAGMYKITLFATGTLDDPILANMLEVIPDSELTIAAVGTLNSMEFLGITDTSESGEPDKAMIRFLHLSPDAPAVDITLPDGTVLFSDIFFKEITPYLTVPSMNYTLQVRVTDTPTVALTVPDINLEAGKAYTIYAIGLVNETPELEALLVPDGI